MDLNQTSQSTRSSQDGPTSTGECPTCRRNGITIVGTTGLLWRHGPRNNPCAGTNELPIQGSIRSASSGQVRGGSSVSSDEPSGDLFDASLISPSLSFRHLEPQTPILRRIPKGARRPASDLLTRLLRDVLVNTSMEASWARLLGFAPSCFATPERGRKSRNLTAVIIRQIQECERGNMVGGFGGKREQSRVSRRVKDGRKTGLSQAGRRGHKGSNAPT